MPNFVVINLGVHPEQLRYREAPSVDIENLTSTPRYLGR